MARAVELVGKRVSESTGLLRGVDGGLVESGGSGFWGAAANLTNSIVGSGILGIAFALSRAGLVGGVLSVVAVGVLSDYTLGLMARLSVLHGKRSYESLVGHAFGVLGWMSVGLAQFAFAFGALISYSMLIRDTCAHLLPSLGRYGGFGIGAVVLLGVSFGRDFTALERLSALSMLGVVVMVAVAVVVWGWAGAGGVEPSVEIGVRSTIGESVGTIAFAFVCQHQAPLILNSMQNKTPEAFQRVARVSVGVAVLLSLTMGVVGYFSFGSKVQADIFLSFFTASNAHPALLPYVTTAQACLLLNMLLTFPAELLVCRETIENALDAWRFQEAWKKAGAPIFDSEATREVKEQHEAEVRRRRSEEWPEHASLTVVIWVCAVGIAAVVEDMGDVLEIVGAVAATALAFILPTATHLRIGASPTDVSHPLDRKNWLSLLVLTLGVALFFAATTLSILGIVQRKQGEAENAQDVPDST